MTSRCNACEYIVRQCICIPERGIVSKVETNRFVRKPFFVDAVQVTRDNMYQVADWCFGTVVTKDDKDEDITPYIQVRVLQPLREKQTKAYPTNWVLYAGRGYKIYTDKAFKASFDLVVQDDPNYGEHLVGSNVD